MVKRTDDLFQQHRIRMRISPKWISVALCSLALFVSTNLSAAPEPDFTLDPDVFTDNATQSNSVLQEIQFASLPGDRVQITLKMSGIASEPTSFTVDNPARIALDFPNTKNALPWRSKNVGMGLVKSVAAIESGSRTRVVINLVKQVAYNAMQDGTNYVLTLGRSNLKASAPVTSGFSTAAGPKVENIDFRRGDAGEGRVVVTFSEANVPVDIREEGGKVVVEFVNVGLPNTLQQRLDVIDFATPVKNVDTFTQGENVRMEIQATGSFEHLAYQSDNTLTIDVKPRAVPKDVEVRKAQYTGEKLSLNFQDIEVRAVLQLLADFTGLNVVVSDTVQGNITLRLKNTPWDQALDIILKTKGLAMRQNGTVILVAPSEEIADREKLELESQRQISELAPLRSELLQINYAKAAQLAEILKSEQNTLLSERGNVTVDARTNNLLVRDTVDRLDEIRKLISNLDKPIRQVMIESRIVIAEDSFIRDLGARIGVRGVSEAGNTTIVNGATSGGLSTTPTLGDGFNVNLPAEPSAGTAASIALGFLSSSAALDLELSALQAEGKGEVISNPRVITSNQKEAFIEQGDEIPYQQSTSSGATAVQFRKAVMSLRVTPQITPDDRVILDLQVTKDTPFLVQQELGADNGGGQTVGIRTKELETQVLVDNGETVVLGGIYEQEKRKDRYKVPFLGDIPFLGALFRSTVDISRKNELLIFVTPKILKETLSIQ